MSYSDRSKTKNNPGWHFPKFDSSAGHRVATYRRDTMQDVKELLEDVHGDRVFAVEDGVVWVSGMNANCRHVARKMARTLVKHDIPAGLVYDDGAAVNGGVQFNYGEAA